MSKINRYSIVDEKFPREILLLVGTGCIWKKCTFCDYYNDLNKDPFKINKPVLEKITGQYGVLDVINSGSCFELDENTLNLLKEKVKECNIKTLWFESHWLYHKKLHDFRNIFKDCTIKFRVGVETFNEELRNSWQKGIPHKIGSTEIAKYFDGVCLLAGVKGQTKETILHDISLCTKYFEYFSVNIFNENTTTTKIDPVLIDWLKKEVAPKLLFHPKAELLINNTDLGVGQID